MKKDSLKCIFSFLLGSLIFGTLGVLASNNYAGSSTSVTYDNSNSNMNASNVQEAVDNLANKSKYGDASAADIKADKKALSNGESLVGTMPDNGSISETLNAGETYNVPSGYTSGGSITANANTEIYTFPNNSIGTTYDMGLSNKVRYVDATKVYQKGLSDGTNGTNYKYGTLTLTAGEERTINTGLDSIQIISVFEWGSAGTWGNYAAINYYSGDPGYYISTGRKDGAAKESVRRVFGNGGNIEMGLVSVSGGSFTIKNATNGSIIGPIWWFAAS